MSIFDFFRSNKEPGGKNELSLPVNGPLYLRNYLAPPDAAFDGLVKKLTGKGRWFGQLVTPAGQTRFELHYDGWLDEGEVIIEPATDGVLKLVAICAESKKEIVVFDRAYHGWDGFVANNYEDVRLIKERAIHPYPDSVHPGIYKVLVVAAYSENSLNELKDELVDGNVRLGDGSLVPLQDAFDNGFDHFSVYALGENNEAIEIISEELS